MKPTLTRRNFFKVVGVASALSLANANTDSKKQDMQENFQMASIIDIGLCDGCKDLDMPLCVKACQNKNLERFPNPIENIPYYFPRKIYEDYSKNREDISRLTPYNFTYVEKLEIEGKSVYVPRHCMHCDNPTCQKICPFGVISKDKYGAVDIDEHFCFGGAKCRDVCPWGIPQRQAGVGIYLKIAPKLAGGGAMFKCDSCASLLAENKKPVCETSCPKRAIIFGKREEIYKKAQELAQKYKEASGKEGTFIYGDKQNGGTSTFYVSPIPFEELDNALSKKHNLEKGKQKLGVPHLNLEVKNFVSEDSALIKGVLLSPLVGLIAGGIAVAKSKQNKKDS